MFARQTGFIQRSRKVDPVAMLWTLVLGFGVGARRQVAALRRFYEVETGTTLAPSAFYDRFTAGLVRFLRVVLAELLSRCAEPTRKFHGRFAQFRDIVCADATVLKLHEMLEGVYKGSGRTNLKAAAKLHMVMSVVGRGPRTVKLTGERANEGKKLLIGPWVKGRLLLFDLGYYKHQLFDRISRNNGYFVSRLKGNANPRIVGVNCPIKGRSMDLLGQRLKDMLPRLKREILDVDVEVEFYRRAYRGQSSRGKTRFRVVGLKDAQTQKYHLYITNISAKQLDAREIAQAYSLRSLSANNK